MVWLSSQLTALLININGNNKRNNKRVQNSTADTTRTTIIRKVDENNGHKLSLITHKTNH